MAADDPGESARRAVLEAISKAAPRVANSPAGIRDLAEAYAFVERDLQPKARVAHNHS